MSYRMGVLSLFLAATVAQVGCHHSGHNLPPAQTLMHPGPGVEGPGPGVMSMAQPSGVIPASCEYDELGMVGVGQASTSQFAFVGPDGMAVSWDVGGMGLFDSEPLIVPGRQNFPQGGIYRLKLTNIPGRAGVELYPTLEVGPATPRTDAYLAHNSIPVQFTEEDLDQVLSGNFVTKVIYLPDPEFQELALAGVETLVSTRLDPGIDPIVEADRRGAILAIVRLGNKDLEVPGGEPGGLDGQVVPAQHAVGGPVNLAPAPGPVGPPTSSFQPQVMPPQHVSGVTGPQWGMPITGTPIGLPGPPHVPLGVPAGLQKHVIKNRTHTHLPKPVRKFRINVKQRPGISYPKPVSRVRITERAVAPHHTRAQCTDPACTEHGQY